MLEAAYNRADNLRQAILLCWHYGLQRHKTDMAYRADYWFSVTIGLFNLGVQLFFIWALFSQLREIGGWSFEEVVLIYGINRVSFAYFSMACFEAMARFSDFYIIEGNLDRLLLRPVNPLLQVIMENISLRHITQLITGTVIVAWAMRNVEPAVDVTVGSLLLVHGLALLGAFIFTGVFITLASLSFWVKDRVGFVSPLFSITEASRWPMTIYHPAVQLFFTIIIPFGFCAFYPAAYLTDPGTWTRWIVWAPLVAIASFSFGAWLFRRGLRVYESTGS